MTAEEREELARWCSMVSMSVGNPEWHIKLTRIAAALREPVGVPVEVLRDLLAYTQKIRSMSVGLPRGIDDAINRAALAIHTAEAQVSQAGGSGSVPPSGPMPPGQSRPAAEVCLACQYMRSDTSPCKCGLTTRAAAQMTRAAESEKPTTPLAEPAPEELTMERLLRERDAIAATNTRISQEIDDIARERDALRAEVTRLTNLIEDRAAADFERQDALEKRTGGRSVDELVAEVEAMRPVVEAAPGVLESWDCGCGVTSGCKRARLRGALDAYRRAKGDAK